MGIIAEALKKSQKEILNNILRIVDPNKQDHYGKKEPFVIWIVECFDGEALIDFEIFHNEEDADWCVQDSADYGCPTIKMTKWLGNWHDFGDHLNPEIEPTWRIEEEEGWRF